MAARASSPNHGLHVEVEFRVACAPESGNGHGTIAFVSALQDRYALKKSNNSASVGVPAIGSLMLPFSSSDDALVKVASETLTAPKFYDGFFMLLQRYLGTPAEAAPEARAADPRGSPPDTGPPSPAAHASNRDSEGSNGSPVAVP